MIDKGLRSLGEPCPDCVVGEPHCCPELFDPSGEQRRYQLLTDLSILNGASLSEDLNALYWRDWLIVRPVAELLGWNFESYLLARQNSEPPRFYTSGSASPQK